MTRVHSIDVLKLLVALGVVWAHAVLLGSHYTDANYIFGQGIVRAAVPTFATISGFLLYSTWHRGKTPRWVGLMVATYLFWCLIYAPVWRPQGMEAGKIVLLILTGPLHLWYMAALVLAVGLMALVLTLSPDEGTAHRRLLILGVITLPLGAALQAVDFFTGLDLPLNAYRNGLFVEFPYAAFGFLVAARLRRLGRDSLPPAWLLWLAVAGLALLRMAEAAMSLRLSGLGPVAMPEFPPLAAAFSLALLLATLRLNLPKPPVNLALLSLAIYFLHYIVLLGALHLGIRNLTAMLLLGALAPVAVAQTIQLGSALLRRRGTPDARLAQPVRKRP